MGERKKTVLSHFFERAGGAASRFFSSGRETGRGRFSERGRRRKRPGTSRALKRADEADQSAAAFSPWRRAARPSEITSITRFFWKMVMLIKMRTI